MLDRNRSVLSVVIPTRPRPLRQRPFHRRGRRYKMGLLRMPPRSHAPAALLGGCTLLITSLGAVGPARGAADSGADPVSLEWVAPSECPSAAEVRAELERLLGGPPRLPGGTKLVARASVRHEDLWRVVLQTGTAPDERWRSLEADTCQGLADAVALILALAIDPNAVAEHRADPPRAPSQTDTHPAPANARQPLAPPVRSSGATEPSRAPERASPRGRVHWLVGPAAAAQIGMLPEPSVALGAEVGAEYDRFELGLAGQSSVGPASAAIRSPARAGGRFRFRSASLVGCFLPVGGWLRAGLCADFDFGIMKGRAFGVTRSATQTVPWFAVGAGGLLQWRPGSHLSVPLRVDALVPTSRPRFVITHVEGQVFRTAVVSGRVTLGVDFRY
jgi:hypothetical protein